MVPRSDPFEHSTPTKECGNLLVDVVQHSVLQDEGLGRGRLAGDLYGRTTDHKDYENRMKDSPLCLNIRMAPTHTPC